MAKKTKRTKHSRPRVVNLGGRYYSATPLTSAEFQRMKSEGIIGRIILWIKQRLPTRPM